MGIDDEQKTGPRPPEDHVLLEQLDLHRQRMFGLYQAHMVYPTALEEETVESTQLVLKSAIEITTEGENIFGWLGEIHKRDWLMFHTNNPQIDRWLSVREKYLELRSGPVLIRRLESLGQALVGEPIFAATIDVFGEVFVSGGSVHRGLNSWGHRMHAITWSSDVDAVVDCSVDELQGKASELNAMYKEAGILAQALFVAEPIPRIIIRSDSDKDEPEKEINLISAQHRASLIKEIAQHTGEEIDCTGSDLAIFFGHWPVHAISQVAVRFRDDGDIRVVNAGLPLTMLLEDRSNNRTFTTAAIIRTLKEQGQERLVDGLIYRTMKGIARLPKFWGKKLRMTQRVDKELVDLGLEHYQQMQGSEDKAVKKLSLSLREMGIQNAKEAKHYIDRYHTAIWDGLMFSPFVGLYSATLHDFAHQNYMKIHSLFTNLRRAFHADSFTSNLVLMGALNLSNQENKDPAKVVEEIVDGLRGTSEEMTAKEAREQIVALEQIMSDNGFSLREFNPHTDHAAVTALVKSLR